MDYLQYNGQLYSIVTGNIEAGRLWIPVDNVSSIELRIMAILGWVLAIALYYALKHSYTKNP